MITNDTIADVVVCGTSAIVRLRGELDIANYDDLRAALLAACTATGHLTIELGDVEFIDWTATALILCAVNELRGRGGSVTLAGARPPVRRMLFLVGLDRLLTA